MRRSYRFGRYCVDCRVQPALSNSRRCDLCHMAEESQYADIDQHTVAFKLVYPTATTEIAEANFRRQRDRQKANKNAASGLRGPLMSPKNEVIIKACIAELIERIGRLGAIEAQVAALRLGGTRIFEIAQHLGCSTRTVQQALTRIRHVSQGIFPTCFA